MVKIWTRGLMATGLGLTVFACGAHAQVAERPARPATPAPATGNPNQNQGQARNAGNAADLPGPIDNPKDVQDTLKMAFMVADANHDGQISKKEAADAGNLVVGGLFFRADANGDGKVTQEEARAVREELMRQNPMLRVLVQEARQQKGGQQQQGTNPTAALANLLDTNNDNALQASEVRQAVSAGVDGLYTMADTNRDGQLTPAELNAAVVGMARAMAQAAFRMADTDNNGQISQAEFDKAILEPAHVVFGAVDTNNDGQISPQEAQAAQQMLMSQMQLAIPNANGARGPVPNINLPTPAGGQPEQPTRTAPGTGAAPAQPR